MYVHHPSEIMRESGSCMQGRRVVLLHVYNVIIVCIYSPVPPVIFDELLSYFNLSGLPDLKEIPRTQDSHSGPIFIPGSLIYGDETFSRMFVSILLIQIYSYCEHSKPV